MSEIKPCPFCGKNTAILCEPENEDEYGVMCHLTRIPTHIMHYPSTAAAVPTRIIYNPPATICYFEDGSRVIVRAGKDEKYDCEVGVMACIMRKLFKTRSEFLRLVESGYEQRADSDPH